jgi:hypothetical protein
MKKKRSSTVRRTTKIRGGSTASAVKKRKLGVTKSFLLRAAGQIARNQSVQFAVATGSAMAAERGKRFMETTSKKVVRELEKRLSSDSPETLQKLLPRAHGSNDSDVGALHSVEVNGYQEVAGREVNRYGMGKKITAIHDKQMQMACNLYGEQRVITDVIEPKYRGTLRYHSGFNCKGFAYPAASFNNISNTAAPPDAEVKRTGGDCADYALAFTVKDYWNAMAQSTGGSLPNVTDEPGDVDIFYAFKSIRLNASITNSNGYYPIEVKIYLLKAKTKISSTKTPTKSYFGTSTTTQAADLVNYEYIKWATQKVVDPTLTYVSQVSMLPQVTPAMSTVFKTNYDIVSVDKRVIAPNDSIDYVLEKEIPHVTSYREIDRYRRESISMIPGDYCLMVEFQGTMALANPTDMPTTNDAIVSDTTSSPVEGLAPGRLRIDVQKSISVCTRAINSTINGVNTLEPDSQATWLTQRNLAAGIDSSVITFNYFDQSKTPGSTGTYALPVYTDEQKQYAGPQVDL